MGGGQFTIMCPSNSSMKLFPKNTAAEFTVQLPEPLNLGEQWEVGLKEIHLTNSWFNIREGRNRFDMRLRMPNKADGSRGDQLVDQRFVTPGAYRSVSDIFKAMNKALARKDESTANWYDIDLNYDKVTRRTIFDTTNKTKNPVTGENIANRRSIRLTGDLATVLGFQEGAIIKSDRVTTSPYAAVPLGSLFNIYVYCDAIEPQVVGGTKTPCLRILPIDAKHDDVVIAKEFNSPNYMSLINHRISVISFKIADDSGENIAFDYGKTVVCLHFRKRSSVS